MSLLSVVIYTLDAVQKDLAAKYVPLGSWTESFVCGQITPESVEFLRQNGLVVQVVPEAQQFVSVQDITGWAQADCLSFLGSGKAEPQVGLVPDPLKTVLVWLDGPLVEEWRAELASLGIALLQVVTEGRYKARIHPEQAEKLAQLQFIRGLQYVEFSPVDMMLGRELSGPPPGVSEVVESATFEILAQTVEGATNLLAWLGREGIEIIKADERKIRIAVDHPPSILRALGMSPDVAAIEKFVPPELYCDHVRSLVGLNPDSLGQRITETGRGQIVAVADSGIDPNHPDFQGRIVGSVGFGRAGDTSDPHGHGTHVAGIILGDGAASSGQFRGVAPSAQLYFQSIMDSGGGLGGLPLSLATLFNDAYGTGARIHNNSWGANLNSRYTINSTETDAFVREFPDMLVVIAAGNSGTARDPRRNSAAGFTDWLSIGSPASCKNALTVGASRSSRTTGGLAQSTYGAAWSLKFPDPPLASERVSGNPQCMAGFSSRGPCDDRRIKPDIVAPGTDIVSAKSSDAPDGNFWGTLSGHPQYALMGGTSMSAPVVSGCAALVREYYCTTRSHEPSAALLKATLLNGVEWLTGLDATAPPAGIPNYHQGFGRVFMPNTIPSALNSPLILEFYDNWQFPSEHLTQTGQFMAFEFSLPTDSVPLRICLAYTDEPARALQNNLNLMVRGPNSQTHCGNALLANGLNGPDTDNNVETVHFERAMSGTYRVFVIASNLLHPGQDYAIVATGSALTGWRQC